MPYKDAEKQKQAKHESYLRNKDKVHASSNAYKKRRRAQLYEWLHNQKRKPCVDCGNIFHPVAMDFHHENDDKEATVAKLVWQCARLERIEQEIRKCVLICSNCHRVRHLAP